MKAIWSKHDWQRAAVSIIPFSPTDGQRIAALHQRVADSDISEIGFSTPTLSPHPFSPNFRTTPPEDQANHFKIDPP